MKQPVRILIGLLAAGLIGYSGFQLYSIFSEYRQGTDLYSDVVSAYTEPLIADPAPSGPPGPVSSGVPFTVDLVRAVREFPDVVGWIYSENGIIHYPVVQAPDNDYYLRRLVDGSDNKAGSIFMDHRNDPSLEDLNTIIYGHNMKNDTMFGTLPDYTAQSYYDQYPVLWLKVKDQTYRIELFTGFVTPAVSDTYQFPEDPAALRRYVEAMASRSDFETSVDLRRIEKIITLSTCTYEYEDARYVVIGALVPVAEGGH